MSLKLIISLDLSVFCIILIIIRSQASVGIKIRKYIVNLYVYVLLYILIIFSWKGIPHINLLALLACPDHNLSTKWGTQIFLLKNVISFLEIFSKVISLLFIRFLRFYQFDNISFFEKISVFLYQFGIFIRLNW